MQSTTDDLRDLFLEVTGEEVTVTERRDEETSRDPIDEDDASVLETVAGAAREDGLDDAVAGAEVGAVGDVGDA